MKKLIAALMVGLLAAIAVADEPFMIAETPDGILYASDRLVVTLLPGTEPLMVNQAIAGDVYTGNDQIDIICRQNNVTGVEPYYPYPIRNRIIREAVERMYVFKLAAGVNPVDIKSNFALAKDVEYSDLWSVARLNYMPNDPAIPQQWALSKIQVFSAWDYVRGDTTENVIIAIDDSGVFYNHPDLQANVWINGPEDLNGNGIFDNYPANQGGDLNYSDDDGNGYPDDVVAWDFGYNDNDPEEDTAHHGTHVAGCASMVTDNGVGGAGPGFSARLMTTKATNSVGYITHGYPAMIYAADNGAHIVNCSWGSYYYSSGEQNIVSSVTAAGCLVVAAAGNENTSSRSYPASYVNVLSVASTDQNDIKSSFSDYGTTVDVCAPGEYIYSTWAANSYSYQQGTSMSSPVAAGVCALVKAQNMNYTPIQITNIMITTCDNIDSLNPNYQGLLGAGRINAYAAVAANNSPNIRLFNHSIYHYDSDGDNVINPGESIDITVMLENVWQTAENVVATLRAPSGISVTDSVSSFGTFPGGGEQRDNSADPFSLTYGVDLPPGVHELCLNITAIDYATDLNLTVEVSLFMANFPVNMPDAIESDPLIFDFDRDGSLEIVVGCNDAQLYAIENNGAMSPNFPVTASDDINSAPAVGDIDNNGSFEIVAVARNGEIYAWDDQGNVLNGFPYATGGTVFTGPTLADLDGNGDLEIILPNFQTKNIEIINHDGSVFGNWPYTSPANWYGSVAVGNIDGDSQLEIAVAGFDSLLHVFNADKTEVTGFPVHLDSRCWISPAIGDIDAYDPEPEIVIATQSGAVYLVNHDGSFVSGWPINVGTAVKSSPSLGDLDGDGNPEIVFGGSNSNLYAYDFDGTALDGFPKALLAGIMASPVIADITGEGSVDVIIANGASGTYVYGFDSQGQALPNFPIPTTALGSVLASPAVWDLDSDGDLDIVVCVQNSGESIDVIDYKRNAPVTGIQWAMFANDTYRSNNFEPLNPVGIDDEPLSLPAVFKLEQNYPNPFNSHTVIQYSLDVPSEYSIDIYNILGQKVKKLDTGYKQAGAYSITWNGLNDNGQAITSGVYFYRLNAGNRTDIKRMLYLK
jgi:subtilisin family serine protease